MDSLLYKTNNTRFVLGIKKLVRSDNLDEISKEDLLKLKKLNIKTIISFRNPKYNSGQLFRDNGFEYHNHHLIVNKEISKLPYETTIYERLTSILSQTKMLEVIIDQIIKSEKRCLIYCKYGTDRTGIVASLIQAIYCIPIDVIIFDFLKSYGYNNEVYSRDVGLFFKSIQFNEKVEYFRKKYSELLGMSEFLPLQFDGRNIGYLINNDFYKASAFIVLEFSLKLLRIIDDIRYVYTHDIHYDISMLNCCTDSYSLEVLDSVIVCELLGKKFLIHEYELAYENILFSLESNFMIRNLDYNNLDVKYLTAMLGVDLLQLRSATIEEQSLEDLRCFSSTNPYGVKIQESRYYKQIVNNIWDDSFIHNNNYPLQKNSDRLLAIIKSIKMEGYNQEKYIIVYNDELIIRDGEHRAAILYYLYGNINLKVLRLRFTTNYYSYDLYHKKKGK